METTLYDATGQPRIYIDHDDDNAIYTWDGRAVAYIDDDENVYGWNGKHLGWFVDGMMYDSAGSPIGFIKSKYPNQPKPEPFKKTKQFKQFKQMKKTAKMRPMFRMNQSNDDLTEFVTQDSR